MDKYNDIAADEIQSKFYKIIQNSLYEHYGEKPDAKIQKQVDEEWFVILEKGLLLDVMTLYEIILWLKENNHPYWMRACAGSSFVFYLLGITCGNPLPPHYYCPRNG